MRTDGCMIIGADGDSVNPNQLSDHLPSLHGDGLLLRWLTSNDLSDLQAIFSDADVVRFTAVSRMTSEAAALEFLTAIHNGFRAGTLYQWGVELEHAIVGTCTLANIDRQHRRAELGFALAKAFWGRGLILRALPAVIQFAFDRLDLHRIEADTDPRNVASMRVLERLGFRREGLLRERYFQFGEAQDAVVFGLLRGDWDIPGCQLRDANEPTRWAL
jgi:[ribosomal protein S5]-alanine N-acetyltransferase